MTMGRILSPGMYDMPAPEYHGEPCDGPCLGSGGAVMLAHDCPAAYRYRSDNPEEKDAFDIGTATHLLVLEPEKFRAAIGVVDADSWRTKDAQAARAALRGAGRIPLLAKDHDAVLAMRDSIAAHPIAKSAFTEGKAEASIFWKDAEFGCWKKCRPDWLPNHRRYYVDLKTSTSADPADFSKTIATFGYYMRAAWYQDGIEAVTGQRPERVAFVVVSKKPPHLVSVCWLDQEAIEWGRIANRYATGVFAWCVENNVWPDYQPEIGQPPAAFTVNLPSWQLRELQERHERGGFVPPQEKALS